MPHVEQYRNNRFADYDAQPSASGALLFVGIVAAIIIAGFLWAAYAPQSAMEPGAMNSPATTNTPATQPRSPVTAPTAPAQPGAPNR